MKDSQSLLQSALIIKSSASGKDGQLTTCPGRNSLMLPEGFLSRLSIFQVINRRNQHSFSLYNSPGLRKVLGLSLKDTAALWSSLRAEMVVVGFNQFIVEEAAVLEIIFQMNSKLWL